jgi:2-C-methyl-D-erythritol 4-phosphate cytidylyltransferase
MRVTAIVVAAGAGRRIGGDIAKTYMPIAGRPLVLRTLDRLFSAPVIDQVVLVIAAEEIGRCEALLRSDAALRGRPWLLQGGGATRQQSARLGLEKVGADTDIVMIHDGARPFVSVALIERSVAEAADKGAVVVGLPARDTIKKVSSDGYVETTPVRGSLWAIQTPQVFRRELIVAAHEKATRDGVEVTDDAMVVERMGEPVFVIEGERLNFKITVPEDVWLAELLIREGRVP